MYVGWYVCGDYFYCVLLVSVIDILMVCGFVDLILFFELNGGFMIRFCFGFIVGRRLVVCAFVFI